MFENLKNLSKIGRLNYANLKSCGPILLYRLNEDITFEQVKRKCADIWSINIATYSLYDDSFNNLECCSGSKIPEFFNSYQSHDNTFGPGQVCFYMIEKQKHQRDLLDSQDKCKYNFNINICK